MVENPKQKEDLETYGQLPDLDEFQWRDMGIDTDLSHIAEKIYASFRNPTCGALKLHLVTAATPKELFRELKSLGENDKKGDFKQERVFGRVAKTPISNTFNELV